MHSNTHTYSTVFSGDDRHSFEMASNYRNFLLLNGMRIEGAEMSSILVKDFYPIHGV